MEVLNKIMEIFQVTFLKYCLGEGITFLSPKTEAAVLTEPYAPFYCFVMTHFPALTAT